MPFNYLVVRYLKSKNTRYFKMHAFTDHIYYNILAHTKRSDIAAPNHFPGPKYHASAMGSALPDPLAAFEGPLRDRKGRIRQGKGQTKKGENRRLENGERTEEEEDFRIDSKVRCVGAHPFSGALSRREIYPIKLANDHMWAGWPAHAVNSHRL